MREQTLLSHVLCNSDSINLAHSVPDGVICLFYMGYMSQATQEAEAMEAHPWTLEDRSWMWECPEPTMPPGLNREQAWAWAMDNFPALSRPSCEPGHLHGEWIYGSCGLLCHASTWHGDVPAAERGQKRRGDPHIQDPMTESDKELQSPQGEVDAADSATQWGLNQPGDASTRGDGERYVPRTSLSPNHRHKRLKVQA